MNWQPIETAPRDGTWILAIDSSHLYYFAFWCPLINGWTHYKSDYEKEVFDVKYWIPLPEPPAEDKE